MSLDTSYMYGVGQTTTGTTQTTTSTAKGKHDLDMNDFLMLMVEQMKNQDIGSTMDTSEYINQLSQYTMIQAVSEMAQSVSSGFENLQQMTLSTYSMSMIGKEATLAVDDGEGNIKTINGTISGVTFYEGSPKVIMNGEQYELSSVMSLGETANQAASVAEAVTDAVREVLRNDQESEQAQTQSQAAADQTQENQAAVTTDAEILAGQNAASQRIAEDSE